MYAQVAVDSGSASLDFFTYLVPGELKNRATRGSCVLVPFGNRQILGFIVGFQDSCDLDRVKEIIAVIDTPASLSPELLSLAEWISSQWLCGLQRTLRAVIPRILNHRVATRVELTGQDIPTTPSLASVCASISELGGSCTVDALKQKVAASSLTRAISELEKRGIIRRSYELELPEAKPRFVKAVTLAVDAESARSAIDTLTEKQARVLRMCLPGAAIELQDAIRRAATGRGVISALEDKGFVKIVEIAKRRAPSYSHEDPKAVKLTDEQTTALEAIKKPILAGENETLLIHGVTASGKTEIYLRAIEETLGQGRTCMVLVPEISLTTQVMNIFKSRFGDDVAVLHSALGSGERHDEWMRAQTGDARVVLGPRSALFAPLKNLGLLVMDEEHEPTFKQENDPRYHARDAAVKVGSNAGAAVVLGSATPSIESYYKALKGDYHLVELMNRVESRPLPDVYVADLREQYQQGVMTIFTARLREAIQERLDRKEQVILFQNRRAYSTTVLCRECGYVERCPNCAVSLKLHSSERLLRCHHCAFEKPAPTLCPDCSGNKIKGFGLGTERVEAEVTATFPNASVLRMDRDTTTAKGSHEKLLGAFRRREADILVGTQMIAKGLDFPHVTLVGVISADTSLNMPDFRAAERTFQLLSQVAGRAGRGTTPGEVIIQTFEPDHYAVQCAVRHDYKAFYEQEIGNREELNYPPFSSLINIISVDESEKAAKSRIEAIANKLLSIRSKNIEIRGPAPAPLAKLRGKFRYHLVLRSSERREMVSALKQILSEEPGLRRGIAIDVDPMTML